MFVEQFENAAQVLLVDPVEDKTIGRLDTQLVAFGFDL